MTDADVRRVIDAATSALKQDIKNLQSKISALETRVSANEKSITALTRLVKP